MFNIYIYIYITKKKKEKKQGNLQQKWYIVKMFNKYIYIYISQKKKKEKKQDKDNANSSSAFLLSSECIKILHGFFFSFIPHSGLEPNIVPHSFSNSLLNYAVGKKRIPFFFFYHCRLHLLVDPLRWFTLNTEVTGGKMIFLTFRCSAAVK